MWLATDPPARSCTPYVWLRAFCLKVRGGGGALMLLLHCGCALGWPPAHGKGGGVGALMSLPSRSG